MKAPHVVGIFINILFADYLNFDGRNILYFEKSNVQMFKFLYSFKVLHICMF